MKPFKNQISENIQKCMLFEGLFNNKRKRLNNIIVLIQEKIKT